MNIEEAQKLISDILTVTQKEEVNRAVADVQNGVLSLLELVENLRPKLTAREADLRANGVNELCAILLRLECTTKTTENSSSHHHIIDSKDCDFLLDYLLARVEDSGHLADLLITAIHHLLITYYGGGSAGKSLESSQLDRALTVLFENNGVQSYGQRDRHLLFAMFEHLLDTHCAQLRQLGPQRTVMAFLHSAQGEREPRVLLSVFRLHQKVASQLRLGLLGGQQSQLDLLGKILQAVGGAEKAAKEENKDLLHGNANFAPPLLLPFPYGPIMACHSTATFRDCEENSLKPLSSIFEAEHLSECTNDSLFKYPMAGLMHGTGNRLVIPLKVRATQSPSNSSKNPTTPAKNYVVYFIVDSGAPFTSFSEKTAEKLFGEDIPSEVYIQDTMVNCGLSTDFNETMKKLNLLGSQFMSKSNTTLMFSPRKFDEFGNNSDMRRVFYLTTLSKISHAQKMAASQQNPSVVYTHQQQPVSDSYFGCGFSSSGPTNRKRRNDEDRSTTTSSAEPGATVMRPSPETFDANSEQQPTGSTSEANVQEEKPRTGETLKRGNAQNEKEGEEEVDKKRDRRKLE